MEVVNKLDNFLNSKEYHFASSGYELSDRVFAKSKFCKYLVDITGFKCCWIQLVIVE